jgi:hypothetical protein
LAWQKSSYTAIVFTNAVDGLLAERSYAGRDNCDAAKQMLAELVVERTNLVGLGGHGWSPSGLNFGIHGGNPNPGSEATRTSGSMRRKSRICELELSDRQGRQCRCSSDQMRLRAQAARHSPSPPSLS